VITGKVSLRQYLDRWSHAKTGREQIAETVECIATMGAVLAQIVARYSITSDSDHPRTTNSDGDVQTSMDILAHNLFENALRSSPVGILVSEELEEAVVLNQSRRLAVAIDPLDGSSNLETNIPVGSIFSIFEFEPTELPLTKDSFLNRQGSSQVAAGFFMFGPQTKFVLTLLDGTHIFTLDPETSEYVLTHANVRLPDSKREFAINASNYRYWDDSIRGYVDDCIAGEKGPREENYNMRWIASLVAEVYRILVRGGIFLYPRDTRPDYKNGRLRLLYEAFPISLLIEQAGGAATDGEKRILDQVNSGLHGRVPLIFGSNDKVERVARYYATPPVDKNRYALFEPRQLLRN
jgi:fructose-1,6-bisphosphatase I